MIVILLIALVFCSNLQANTIFPYKTLELRGGAFIPFTSVFRGIYGNAGGFLGVQAGGLVADHVEVWGCADWFGKTGNSIGLCSPTRVDIATFSFGASFPYAFADDRVILYAGLGPCIGGVWTQNETVCCGCPCKAEGDVAGGFVIKTGFYVLPAYRDTAMYAKFFADLVVEWAHFCTPCSHQVGGLELGMAFGIKY